MPENPKPHFLLYSELLMFFLYLSELKLVLCRKQAILNAYKQSSDASGNKDLKAKTSIYIQITVNIAV